MSGKFLIEMLGQSEQVQELIRQSVEELSSATNGDALFGADNVFDSRLGVTRQLRDASKKLTTVIQSLRVEIRDRNMIDHLLAAAVEQEEGARSASLHDGLTGLPNHLLFKDRLEQGIAQAKRHRWTLAVMFIDLDNFKTVNDTYGHQAGDSVLQTVATRLRHITRQDDTISRYGGDEFLYLLSQIRDERDISVIADNILKAIQAPCQENVLDVDANPIVKASIGISVYPRDGTTVGALIRSADGAMYEAKEDGSGYAFAHKEPAPYVRLRTEGYSR
jgi:diguanylate cyclase (GGDEF)-like protein